MAVPLTAVIARFNRAIQYPETCPEKLALATFVAAYWMPRLRGA
ncbi:exonuclease VII small subunit [Bradyrhizobium sp. USDA 4354]